MAEPSQSLWRRILPEDLQVDDWRHGGFGVYIHWPFCAAKCPYCDFNSHVRRSVDQDRWRRALIAEIQRTAAESPGRVAGSVFFGGGTPSLMPPDTVAAILSTIEATWGLADDAEITLEANPTSVEANRFREFRLAGVNRISIGIQAMNDTDLRALGRLHTAREALASLDVASGIFDRVSIDLIYARQGQTREDWRVELAQALSLGTDHLSLYQLTIEEGTRFGKLHATGRLRGLPNDDLAADLYCETQDMCAAAGLPAYEVSNHAKAGAQGRHNLTYWRYGDYAAVGPGAHGRLSRGGKRWATETHLVPQVWIDAVERTGTGVSLNERLSSADQAVELLLMGLRLDEGISLSRFRRLRGADIDADSVVEMAELGLVIINGDRLKATARGRPLLDTVIKTILNQ